MQITINNASRILNVSTDKIYQWIKKEEIPYIKISDQYYFDKVELLEWANINGFSISSEIFSDINHLNFEYYILFESLSQGGIFYDVNGDDTNSVLKSVVSLLNLPDDIDRDFLYDILLSREALGSTGIGNRIAIPHPRNPLILNIQKPSISLCFLNKPIDFKSIDGLPVDILFIILSSSVNIHLKMLSRLAYVLSYKDFKELLQKRSSEQEILEMIKKIEIEINNKEKEDSINSDK